MASSTPVSLALDWISRPHARQEVAKERSARPTKSGERRQGGTF